METPENPADEQKKLWNGSAGRAWVDEQQVLDRMFRSIEEVLAEAAAANVQNRPVRVLDVGCGTGSTTLAAARRLGAKGRCTGLDISEPMLALARTRAEREGTAATFICADAQTYAFEPASFDRFISRFGVMFFEDFVGAFTNLRRAAADGAEMRVIVWRSPAENPFMTTAERAAAPLLQNLPPRRPDGPGQFAFADRNRVQQILKDSGWRDIDIQPLDAPCAMTEQELRRYITRLGPVGMLLTEADEQTRANISAQVRAAFDPYVFGDEVRFTAACWNVSARA